jgi:hypothetical protein
MKSATISRTKSAMPIRSSLVQQVGIVLTEEAHAVYTRLQMASRRSKHEAAIFNALTQKFDNLKLNTHYGQAVPKQFIPNEYKALYGVKNLFKIDMPNYWRMLYTITDGENGTEVIVLVLDIFSHEEYNKKFGYRKK